MKPIKAKDLIVSAAMKNNVSVEIASEIIKTYWKEVRTSLSELRSPRIHVTNLGCFTLKYWVIEKYKKKLYDVVECLKDNEKKAHIVTSVMDKIAFIENIEQQLLDENQRKNFIKTHKKHTSNAKPNIQKQETDIRRNKK